MANTTTAPTTIRPERGAVQRFQDAVQRGGPAVPGRGLPAVGNPLSRTAKVFSQRIVSKKRHLGLSV
jgi:hypothetical protein